MYIKVWNGLQNQKQVETHYNTTLVSVPYIFMSSFICSYHVRFGLQTQVSTISKDHWLLILHMSLRRATALCMHNRGLCVVHVTNGLGEQHRAVGTAMVTTVLTVALFVPKKKCEGDSSPGTYIALKYVRILRTQLYCALLLCS